jgi:hypothetical protein
MLEPRTKPLNPPRPSRVARYLTSTTSRNAGSSMKRKAAGRLDLIAQIADNLGLANKTAGISSAWPPASIAWPSRWPSHRSQA